MTPLNQNVIAGDIVTSDIKSFAFYTTDIDGLFLLLKGQMMRNARCQKG